VDLADSWKTASSMIENLKMVPELDEDYDF
jgi:hypothetical protein